MLHLLFRQLGGVYEVLYVGVDLPEEDLELLE